MRRIALGTRLPRSMKLLLAIVLLAGCVTSFDTPWSSAEAKIAPFDSGAITGTATFTETDAGVSLTITLDTCVAGKSYPVYIHEGAACTDETTQGGHWAAPRGEGIPNIVCTATSGTRTTVRALLPPESAWSIGGSPMTNVEGHVVVIDDPDAAMPPRIGCGAISAK